MPQPRQIVTYLFVAAMVVAPFLALLYDLTAGLAVLAAALLATTFIAWDAARQAEPIMRQRLIVLAVVNGVMALVAAGLLLARLLGRI